MKVVINTCYGGFSLSNEGVLRYAAIKGLKVWPEKGRWGLTYWLVPPEERVSDITGKAWAKMPIEDRIAHNKKHAAQTLYDRDIPRDDPALVQVVEELGEKTDGSCANLKVVEIPDDIEWKIEEYDGKEWVAEMHRTWG